VAGLQRARPAVNQTRGYGLDGRHETGFAGSYDSLCCRRERFEPLTLNLLTSKRTLIIFRNIIDEVTITAREQK